MPVAPHFWAQPFRYIRWASHEKPAMLYSVIIGGMGPVVLLAAKPIRRLFGDTAERSPIPLTYPIPPGPRIIPQGFDDE